VGANSGDIVRLVLRRGIRLALIGEGIGIILAFALGISLRTMLFEISPVDPLTHACVAVFVLAVALTACLVPAWRAARIDPVRALRTE
jgi:ABC-type antimicrobial peptide transport system permease subunit